MRVVQRGKRKREKGRLNGCLFYCAHLCFAFFPHLDDTFSAAVGGKKVLWSTTAEQPKNKKYEKLLHRTEPSSSCANGQQTL